MQYTPFVGFILLFPVLFLVLLVYAAYHLLIAPYFSPLHGLPGPPVSGLFGTHLHLLLDAGVSSRETETMVKQYGRTFRIVGLGAVRHAIVDAATK